MRVVFGIVVYIIILILLSCNDGVSVGDDTIVDDRPLHFNREKMKYNNLVTL